MRKIEERLTVERRDLTLQEISPLVIMLKRKERR